MKQRISIVIPAYNEQENIPTMVSRLETLLTDLPYDHEILLVNDGSSDNTPAILQSLANVNPNFFYIELSRNFGHQLALKAGLDHSKGDCVISMDADLQHPPELIRDMIKLWKQGYDVVYTRRKDDPRLSRGKRQSSGFFYTVLNRLSSIELEPGTADFRLMDRRVVDVFKQFNENEPFIRGLVKWMGFRQTAIDYHPDERHAGISKYTPKKMIRFALQGITSFSIKPLYTAVYLGFTFSLLSLLYIPYVIHSLLTGTEVHGWASVIMTIVFFGGLQLIILGIIGIYVGKMFLQSKSRPNYIIADTNLPD